VQQWITQLDHADVATVLEDIEAEKARLAAVDTPVSPPEPVESFIEDEEPPVPPAAVVLGRKDGIDFTSDFPGRTKSIDIRVTYPCDLGNALKELFAALKQDGITIKEIKDAKKRGAAA
jgi:hypothetical protein